jgi:hypothetical protein
MNCHRCERKVAEGKATIVREATIFVPTGTLGQDGLTPKLVPWCAVHFNATVRWNGGAGMGFSATMKRVAGATVAGIDGWHGENNQAVAELPVAAASAGDEYFAADASDDEIDGALVREHLDALTTRQRWVIERRYGLLDGRTYTQQEVAEAMGSRQQAVSKIEQKALARIRGVVKSPLTVEATTP